MRTADYHRRGERTGVTGSRPTFIQRGRGRHHHRHARRAGYQLDAAWTGAYTGSALSFDLTMDADKTVGVTFEAVPPVPERPGNVAQATLTGDQRHGDPGQLGCANQPRHADHVLPHPLQRRHAATRSRPSSPSRPGSTRSRAWTPPRNTTCRCAPGTRRGAARHGLTPATATTDAPASTEPHTPAAPTLTTQSTSAILAEWVAPNDGGERRSRQLQHPVAHRLGRVHEGSGRRGLTAAQLRHHGAGRGHRVQRRPCSAVNDGGEFGCGQPEAMESTDADACISDRSWYWITSLETAISGRLRKMVRRPALSRDIPNLGGAIWTGLASDDAHIFVVR